MQVSIHAPREGCDQLATISLPRYLLFQFTHPGRGATSKELRRVAEEMVSIHAPREGCDSMDEDDAPPLSEFQFTHPGRGATEDFASALVPSHVSIHAPREGCDRSIGRINVHRVGFNSRTPGGVRQSADKRQYRSYNSFNSRTPGGVRLNSANSNDNDNNGFNSRTPGGVRLCISTLALSLLKVSIHAPREGCDW